MAEKTEFNLDQALDKWVKRNCFNDDLTPSNIEEMRDHLLLSVEELEKKNNLTTEEAFAVTQIRFGGAEDWAEEMRLMNEDNFQLRKVVILFGGVLLYFILYHFIYSSSGLFLFWLEYYNDGPMEINLRRMQQYLLTCYFLTGIGIVTLFFMEIRIVYFLSNIKLKPLHIILLFLLLLLFFFVGRIIRYESVDFFAGDKRHRFMFLDMLGQLKNIYPVIFSIGFLALFLRYRKKFFTVNSVY